MSSLFTPTMTLLIVAAAVATYATRISGYLLVKRLETLPPRLDTALNAVPAAVLTTLVAPAFFYGEIDFKMAMAAALVVGFRYKTIPMLISGWMIIMVLRHLII